MRGSLLLSRPRWLGGSEGRANLRTRRMASPRAWVHEVVDQRAHASFVPFVTWSTNPQYLIPSWRTSGRSVHSGGRRPCGISRSSARLGREHRQGVCHPRAAHYRSGLVFSRGSCLAGPPSCEAIHTQGEGHAVCTTPKYWSDQGV